MSALTFIILGLATWRITLLLVVEEGPKDVFTKLRLILGVRYDEYGKKYGINMIGELMSCAWCTSVWVGALVWLTQDYLFELFGLLALSGMAVLLENYRDSCTSI